MPGSGPARATPIGPRDVVLLLVLAIAWGAAFLFIKIAVADVPPLTLVAARLVIAGVLLAGILYGGGGRLPMTAATWRGFFVIAVMGNVLPFTLIGWGETRIDSALAAILIGTTPLFTVLFAHWFTGDERLSRTKLLGIALGFAGLAVLVGPKAAAGMQSDIAAKIGVGLAAASYAAAAVYALKLARVSPLVAATGSTVAAALLAVPLALLVDQPWQISPTPAAIAAILALAVISTALGALLFFTLLARAGATFASLSNYLIPVSGVLWGVLFLDETPGGGALLALAMILGSIALVRRARRT